MHCQSATEAIKVEEPLYPHLENQENNNEIKKEIEKTEENQVKSEIVESKPEVESQSQPQIEAEAEAESEEDSEPPIVSSLSAPSQKKKNKRAYRFQQQLQQLLG